MAEGGIGSIIDSLIFDSGYIGYVRIVPSNANVLAIAYCDAGSNEKLCTVSIDNDGSIPGTVQDSVVFNGNWCGFASICRHSENVLMAVFRADLTGGGRKGTAFAFVASAAGDLPDSPDDYLTFYTDEPIDTSCCHLTGNIMVIAITDASADGRIYTVSVTSEGEMPATIEDVWEYQEGISYDCHIINVNSGIVALVYRDSSVDGQLITFSIAADGTITKAAAGALEFEESNCSDPFICHVTGDIYAIVYLYGSNSGYFCTVSISSTGVVGPAVLDSWIFASSDYLTGHLINIGEWGVAVVREANDHTGQICTFAIAADGTITKEFADTLEFDSGTVYEPRIVHMQGNIYAISYFNGSDEGIVKSVDIETPTEGRASNITMMGVD